MKLLNKKLISHFLVVLVLLTLNGFLLRPVLGENIFFPSHDSTWLVRLQQFDRAIKLGQFPPRLAPDMAFGFGYPLFKYYAPLFAFFSWLIFKIVGSYSLAVTLAIFNSNFLGSLGMFFLAKNFWGFWGGILSAIAFLFLPYRALDIYVRGAFAELLAINILPFLFYFFFKIINAGKHPQKRDIAGLIFSSFFFILAHNLYLLIFACLSPLVLVYLVMKGKGGKEKLKILIGGAFLSLLLSSFYWLPLVLGIKDIDVWGQATRTNFADHFVYLQQIWNWPWGFGGSAPGLADGMSFKAGKLQILLALAGLVLGFLERKKRKEFSLLALLGIVSLGLSLPFCRFFWENIPVLPIIQFPWRFLGVFGLTISFFAGGIFSLARSRLARLILLLGAAGGLIFLNYKYFVPQKTIANANEYFLTKEKIEREAVIKIQEYFPVGVKEKPEAGPDSAIELRLDQSVDVVLNSPFKIIFRVGAPALHHNGTGLAGGEIIANRFYFPGWQAKYKNKVLEIRPNDVDGRIVFDTGEVGEHILNFVSTPVEKISWGLSLLGVFVLFLFLVY